MTIQQIHTLLRNKLDALDSSFLATFYPEQLDLFLNDALRKFVKARVEAPSTQRVMQDLRELKAPDVELSVVTANGISTITLPEDFWFAERWHTENGIYEVDENFFEEKRKDPFERRTLLTYNGRQAKVLSNNIPLPSKAYLTYLFKPPLISLEDNVTIPLSDHCHDEIVDLALQEILMSLQRVKTS